MPSITLKYKNKILPVKYKALVLQKYPVSLGQTVTIGRHNSNDIVIDNMAVSGKHARIDSVSTTFVLTDLESTNGTFVNEQPISIHGLKDNDVILIGKHELVFDRSDLEKKSTAGDEDGQDDKTCVLDTSEYRDLINQSKATTTNTSTENSSEGNQDEGGGFLSKLFKK